MIKLNYYKNKVAGNENYGKVYARVETSDPMTLEGLAQHMSEHNTTFSKGVMVGFLTDMVKCIHEQVLNGISVKLDNLCIFTPSVNVKPAESVDKFDIPTNVKAVKLTCRATGDMRRAELTKVARLGYTSLANRIKAGELILSSTKGQYIEDVGSGGGEPTVNP